MATNTPTQPAHPPAAAIEVCGGNVSFLHKGAGAPLVVLHHSISSHGWLPLHERLAGRFAVHVPDLPGWGDSDRPDWARNVRDLAILVELWLEAMDLRGVTLVGCGFGGWVAAELATMNQRRLAGLVLVGAAGIRPREGAIIDQLVVDYIDYVRGGFHDEAEFERYFGDDPPRETRMLLYGGREMTMRVTWKPWMFNDALPVLLTGVHTPTLVVWGAHDAIVPLDCGEQFAEAAPNATLRVIEDGGHLLDFERPDALAELIEDFAGGA